MTQRILSQLLQSNTQQMCGACITEPHAIAHVQSASTRSSFYMPDIVSATDYYPFGMTMQERTYSAGGVGYRFGFNGKENDAESNTQDYGMRIYETRLGRFLSVDPDCFKYASLSSYCFAANSPIQLIDINGKGPGDAIVIFTGLVKQPFENTDPQ
nr:RHS repeat-associated core domain-containing protein [Bacteroidota bacterium]